jgi:tetratricopeptide (TPR) repeat protein
MDKTHGSKVVLLPTVIDRYLEKAFLARGSGKFDEALDFLTQILRFDPDHPAALFAVALTLYEAKRFDEAAEIVGRMWTEALGDRTAVVRLYLSSLIQMEDFTNVSRLLSEAQEDADVQITQDLLEIKQACDLLHDSADEEDIELSRESVLDRIEKDPNYASHLYSQLDSGTFEEQLSAIEQMKYIHTQETVSVLKEYLLLVYPDPLLKTFAVRALKDMGETGQVFIHKFSRIYEANIEDVPLHDKEVPEEEQRVIEMVSRISGNYDASFLPFALQLWMEYLFSIFPLHPPVKSAAAWAAALHYATAKLLYIKASQKEIASIYEVGISALSRNYRRLNDILEIETRIP